MARKALWAIVGLFLSLTGTMPAFAQTEKDAPQTPTGKNLPEENDVTRYDSVGDLLADCAKKQPANTELSWFANLPAKQQEEVVNELNQYTLMLSDHIKVKARIKDDYDMRWAFTQPKPQVKIQPPPKVTGRTDSLEVAIKETQVLAQAKEENERRQLTVIIDWKPAQNVSWDPPASLATKNCRFTVSFDFKAAPEFDNFVVRNMDVLGPMKSIKLLDDGSVVMTVKPSIASFTIKLWVAGAKDYADQVTLKPGDYVSVVLVDALGAGSSGYLYQGVQNGHLRFEENTSFYGVIAATKSSIELSPYDKKIENPKK